MKYHHYPIQTPFFSPNSWPIQAPGVWCISRSCCFFFLRQSTSIVLHKMLDHLRACGHFIMKDQGKPSSIHQKQPISKNRHWRIVRSQSLYFHLVPELDSAFHGSHRNDLQQLQQSILVANVTASQYPCLKPACFADTPPTAALKEGTGCKWPTIRLKHVKCRRRWVLSHRLQFVVWGGCPTGPACANGTYFQP